MWCIPELSEDYVACMEDVLALYERPYTASEPVICFDEKPLVLHDEIRPPVPAKPGHVAKRDGEYKRCGTANVFCAVEPLAGRHFAWPTERRSAADFACALEKLVSAYPFAITIHLVLDNLNIHCRQSLSHYYGEQRGGYLWSRLTVHYTPKHGSWLNQAEIEISLFSRQCLGRRRLPSLQIIRQQTRAWLSRVNRDRLKISWSFDRKQARKVFRYAR